MTVATHPFTIEHALRQVLSALGPKHAAAIVGRDPHYVRSLSNPQSRYRLAVDDKIALDLAFDARFGGFPIHNAAGAILDARRTQQPDAATLPLRAADVARETGEAVAAMILAAMPGASAELRREAAREWQEAQAVLQLCGPILHRMLAHGPSP